MNNIAITIGFPVYNVESFVESSLLSVLNQNFSFQYEILVVDDRGKDDSMTIVRRLQSTHTKGNVIRIIQHQNNKGVAEARNTVIDEARGKYLFFLDSDDMITENSLQILYDKAEHDLTDVVVGSFSTITPNGDVVGQFNCGVHSLECIGVGVFMRLKGIDWQIAPWNKLYRTEFVRQSGIRFKHKLFEDVYFDFLMRIYAKSISCVNETTLLYVAREDSLTSKSLQNPDDDSIRNYAAIVNDMQNQVMNVKEIVGIYDFYMLSLRFVFDCVDKKNYTQIQKKLFNSLIKGYLKSIPSVKKLSSNTHKIIYLLNIFSTGYKTYLYIYSLIERYRNR